MAQSVVDCLEAVEIQKQDCYRMRRYRNIFERFFKLLLKQETITKSGQRVVKGEVMRLRLQLLAISNLGLEPLVGINQATGPLFHPAFQILISPAQLLIGDYDLLFRTL